VLDAVSLNEISRANRAAGNSGQVDKDIRPGAAGRPRQVLGCSGRQAGISLPTQPEHPASRPAAVWPLRFH